jgi:hypothetical protein
MSDGGARDDEKPLGWWQILLMWSGIAFGVLFFGGAALRALSGLNGPPPDLGFGTFWCPLAIFSLGGGAAIGLIILTWWFVVKRGSFSWTLGFAVLGVVLFALFVWPSPYRYDKDRRRDATCRVLRIQRWTGDAMCILSANPPPPARPGSA